LLYFVRKGLLTAFFVLFSSSLASAVSTDLPFCYEGTFSLADGSESGLLRDFVLDVQDYNDKEVEIISHLTTFKNDNNKVLGHAGTKDRCSNFTVSLNSTYKLIVYVPAKDFSKDEYRNIRKAAADYTDADYSRSVFYLKGKIMKIVNSAGDEGYILRVSQFLRLVTQDE